MVNSKKLFANVHGSRKKFLNSQNLSTFHKNSLRKQNKCIPRVMNLNPPKLLAGNSNFCTFLFISNIHSCQM